MLIIGASGSRKSTFVNTLVNWILDNDILNLTVAVKCEEYPNLNPEFCDDHIEINKRQGLSQTVHGHYYKISGIGSEYKTLLIVDTPGIASTGGIQEDDCNTLEIMRVARLVKTFNAIFLIQTHSVNKLTPFFKYNLYRISEVIPGDFERSLILVLSHSTSKKPALPNQEYPVPIQKTFFFNNCFFIHKREEYLNTKKLKNKMNKKLLKSKKES